VIGVLSFLFWHGMSSWLNGVEMLSYSSYHIVSIIYVTLLISILALGMALFRSAREALVGLIFAALGFLLAVGFSVLNLVTVGVIILLGWYSRNMVGHEVEQRIKVKSRAMIGAGLTPLIVAMALGVSIVAYQSDAIASLAEEERIPSSSERFIRSIVDRAIDSGLVPTKVSPREKEAVAQQTTEDLISQTNQTLKPYFKYSRPVLAATLFLIIYGLNWIFYWLAIGMGMLLIAVLRLTGFIKIEEVDIKAERMII